jgi:hypothetical protein
MSLDNVVALAAIARGNIFWLAAGVALSLPIIAYGGMMLATLLRRAPWLIEFGAALLGWIALQMATTDALFGDWIDVNAPALAWSAPALGAAFVYAYGRLSTRRRFGVEFSPAVAEAPRPEPVEGDLGLPRSATAATKADLALPRSLTLSLSKGTAATEQPAPTTAYEPSTEPDDHHEPPDAPETRDDRYAIIGVLLLAIVAGAMLMVLTWLDSLN